jgi:hypothetical protein
MKLEAGMSISGRVVAIYTAIEVKERGTSVIASFTKESHAREAAKGKGFYTDSGDVRVTYLLLLEDGKVVGFDARTYKFGDPKDQLLDMTSQYREAFENSALLDATPTHLQAKLMATFSK